MKNLILALFLVFSFADAQMNPYQHIGIYHNVYLEKMMQENPTQFHLTDFSIPAHFSFSSDLTYGDQNLDLIINSMNFDENEKKVVLDFCHYDDFEKFEKWEIFLDSLEKISIKKKYSPIVLGMLSVAKSSSRFWKKPKRDEEDKVPTIAVVKADALGLLKGTAFGALFWVGGTFLGLNPMIGAIGGGTIAVAYTAIDSFRFCKKYKERTELSQ